MRETNIRERKVALASGSSDYAENSGEGQESRKLSSAMAMILGVLGTLEIMVAGAMVFNIDVSATDTLAVFFSFLVLYFGVVAVLTDK